MYSHLKLSEVPTKDLGDLVVRMLLNNPEIPFSVNHIHVKGSLKWTRNSVSDIVYVIVEGSGVYHFDDESITVGPGSVVVIPKNTPYRDEGDFKTYGIASPRFDSNDTVFLER